MSDTGSATNLIPFPGGAAEPRSGPSGKDQKTPAQVAFDRREMQAILKIYGRMVAAGEWRDYAIDMLRDRAVFSVFRRTSEMPLYRIEKDPRRARKQGAYQVVAPGGLVIKRGHELETVLKVFDKQANAVSRW